jgi:hypothetical protein
MNLTIWLFLKAIDHDDFDLLDKCMLDETPCYPDIDQSSKTYHPRIDCEHGRYLLINESLTYRVHHRTGSQLMWYLGILNVAYVLQFNSNTFSMEF